LCAVGGTIEIIGYIMLFLCLLKVFGSWFGDGWRRVENLSVHCNRSL